MLHPLVLADLLDDEVAAAAARLGDRVAGLRHDGRRVLCPLQPAGDSRRWLRLDGARYDGEPFQVGVCGPDGSLLPAGGVAARVDAQRAPGAGTAVRVRAGRAGILPASQPSPGTMGRAPFPPAAG